MSRTLLLSLKVQWPKYIIIARLNRRRPVTRPLTPVNLWTRFLVPGRPTLLMGMLLRSPSFRAAVMSIASVGRRFDPSYPTLKNPLVFRLVLKFVLAT